MMNTAQGRLDAQPIGWAEREQRAAPRFTALLRSAKVVSGEGEFVCVVRDVSTGGVRLRFFHRVPPDAAMALQLPNGEALEIGLVRSDQTEASYRFAHETTIERLICDSGVHPRRLLRLGLAVPLTLRTAGGVLPAVTRNISQQGCCLEAQGPLALAQSVLVESRHLPSIRAKVRWRGGGACGLVFDDTFSLRDFAVLAARLQNPELIGL